MKSMRKTRLYCGICLSQAVLQKLRVDLMYPNATNGCLLSGRTVGTKSSAFCVRHIHFPLPPQCRDGVHTWGLVNDQGAHVGFSPYPWGCTGTGSSFHWGDRAAPVSLPHKFLSSERASADVEIFSALHEGHMTMKVKNRQTRTHSER